DHVDRGKQAPHAIVTDRTEHQILGRGQRRKRSLDGLLGATSAHTTEEPGWNICLARHQLQRVCQIQQALLDRQAPEIADDYCVPGNSELIADALLLCLRARVEQCRIVRMVKPLDVGPEALEAEHLLHLFRDGEGSRGAAVYPLPQAGEWPWDGLVQ